MLPRPDASPVRCIASLVRRCAALPRYTAKAPRTSVIAMRCGAEALRASAVTVRRTMVALCCGAICERCIVAIHQQLKLTGRCMHLTCTGPIWFWKGPAPWYFVTVPPDAAQQIRAVSQMVTYGWGVIPVQAQLGGTTWKTSLIPKDGQYLIPLRASIRKAERVGINDIVTIQLALG